MMSFLAKLKRFNKDDLVPIAATALLIGIVLLDKFFLGDHLQVALTVNYFLIGILAFMVIFVVGFAAMKALVHISAGLSLIIFLAQSYCAVPNLTEVSHNSLKLLLTIALIYLIFDFFSIFYNSIKEYLDILNKPKGEYFWKFLFIFIFVTIVFAVLISVYNVVAPILLDLCVYK